MADQQNEGFVRQRRNLMIVSLVLLFSEATELKVEKISAFGTELLVGQSQAVTTALWVAAVYWLVRFYQYSRVTHEGSLRNTIQIYVVKYEVIWPVIQRRLLQNEPSLIEPFDDIKDIPTLECTVFGSIEYRRNYVEAEVSVSRAVRNRRESVTQDVASRKVRVDGADLFWLRVRAWINLILHTTLFTELVFPYIVFSLPILYAGYKAIRQLT